MIDQLRRQLMKRLHKLSGHNVAKGLNTHYQTALDHLKKTGYKKERRKKTRFGIAQTQLKRFTRSYFRLRNSTENRAIFKAIDHG